MKQLLLALTLLCAQPLHAQETDTVPNLMERGLQLFLEGLLDEVEPTLRDLDGMLEGLEPALRDLLSQVEDWTAYHPPEILENGDIILRKKSPEERRPQEATPDTPREIDI